MTSWMILEVLYRWLKMKNKFAKGQKVVHTKHGTTKIKKVADIGKPEVHYWIEDYYKPVPEHELKSSI